MFLLLRYAMPTEAGGYADYTSTLTTAGTAGGAGSAYSSMLTTASYEHVLGDAGQSSA